MNEITTVIAHAENMGIKIYLQGGNVMLDMPWSIPQTPDPARYILGQIKRRKTEVLVHLLQEQGSPVSLARKECYDTGHCRRFEYNCDLYPVMFPGTWLCRERVKNSK